MAGERKGRLRSRGKSHNALDRKTRKILQGALDADKLQLQSLENSFRIFFRQFLYCLECISRTGLRSKTSEVGDTKASRRRHSGTMSRRDNAGSANCSRFSPKIFLRCVHIISGLSLLFFPVISSITIRQTFIVFSIPSL